MPLKSVGEDRQQTRTLTSGRGGVATYDFRRPTKLSRESVRLLQVAFETFARRVTTLFTSTLRQVSHVELTDLSQQSYGDYIASRPTPTLIAPISLPQLSTTGAMDISLPVALTAVDHMLGGPGGEQQPRPLTDIETNLVGNLLEQLLGNLKYSMEPIVSFDPKLGTIEYNPQFVQVAGAGDAMLVALMNLSIGSVETELSLALPLAPLLPKLASTEADASKEIDESDEAVAVRALLRQRLGDMPIDCSVEFTETTLSPTQILTMAEGDVITLNHRVGAALAMRAGDITYATAVAGRSGKRLAALITETA